MNPILIAHINEIKKLCQEHQVKTLYTFGSVCSENFTEQSDIDFLLIFKPDISIQQYTDNYFDLHYKLEDLFHRKIDLLTEKSLSNPYFIQSVDRSKKLIYES
jgi:predicted nucleotidyltransferase